MLIKPEFSSKQSLSSSGKCAIIGNYKACFPDHCDFPVAEN
jgi:hypothetical protein